MDFKSWILVIVSVNLELHLMSRLPLSNVLNTHLVLHSFYIVTTTWYFFLKKHKFYVLNRGKAYNKLHSITGHRFSALSTQKHAYWVVRLAFGVYFYYSGKLRYGCSISQAGTLLTMVCSWSGHQLLSELPCNIYQKHDVVCEQCGRQSELFKYCRKWKRTWTGCWNIICRQFTGSAL